MEQQLQQVNTALKNVQAGAEEMKIGEVIYDIENIFSEAQTVRQAYDNVYHYLIAHEPAGSNSAWSRIISALESEFCEISLYSATDQTTELPEEKYHIDEFYVKVTGLVYQYFDKGGKLCP